MPFDSLLRCDATLLKFKLQKAKPAYTFGSFDVRGRRAIKKKPNRAAESDRLSCLIALRQPTTARRKALWLQGIHRIVWSKT